MNLEYLDISCNDIDSIDLKGYVSLKYFKCKSNEAKMIHNLQDCKNLVSLNVKDNEL